MLLYTEIFMLKQEKGDFMYNRPLEYLLSNKPEDVVSVGGVLARKAISPIIQGVGPKMNPYQLHVVRKAEMPKGVPIIFAPTHGFKDDFLNTVLLVKKQGYVLFGSLPQFFNTLDGWTAWLNGAVLVDRSDKESRKAAIPKMTRAINLGKYGYYFSEGVWNKRSDRLVLDLFPGLYLLALATGAWIAPVATHVEGNVCHAILDEAFDIRTYSEEKGLTLLREKMMAALYEMIMDYSDYTTVTRAVLESEKSLQQQWDEMIEARIAQVAFYDRKVEDSAEYIDPRKVTEEQVFAPLDQIEITRENAYVLKMTKNAINV